MNTSPPLTLLSWAYKGIKQAMPLPNSAVFQPPDLSLMSAPWPAWGTSHPPGFAGAQQVFRA
jgi:hypothetical protein